MYREFIPISRGLREKDIRGYNYNGKLKSAELLLKEDGSVQLIRRAETPQDYFATLDGFDVYQKLGL